VSFVFFVVKLHHEGHKEHKVQFDTVYGVLYQNVEKLQSRVSPTVRNLKIAALLIYQLFGLSFAKRK